MFKIRQTDTEKWLLMTKYNLKPETETQTCVAKEQALRNKLYQIQDRQHPRKWKVQNL